MADMIPVAQLRAFVERIERIEADIKDLNSKRTRLEYVLNPLAEIGVFSTVAADRAATAGGRLLGIQNDMVRHRAKMVRRRGSVEAALAWLEEWMVGGAWNVPVLAPDLIGFVYAAEAIDFPGIIKVGFSRDPERRLKDLQYQHRIRLNLVQAGVGTEFDEHLIQHRMARWSLANEWFDLDGRWCTAKPMARFYTPDRMWNEMREAA